MAACGRVVAQASDARQEFGHIGECHAPTGIGVRLGRTLLGNDDRRSEAERLDALAGDDAARGEVDGHAGVGQQPPQVGPGVDATIIPRRTRPRHTAAVASSMTTTSRVGKARGQPRRHGGGRD